MASTERRLLLVTLLTLLVGLVLILGPEPIFGPARRSDVWRLFTERGIRPDQPPYTDRILEYPVVLGLIMWATTFVARSPTAFLIVTSLAGAAIALSLTRMLWRRCGQRTLMWAASPTLALYSFHNWDLFAVGPAIGGMLVYRSGSYELAGLLLGLGAGAKWYPALYLGILGLDRLAHRDPRGLWRLAWPAVAVFLAVNLPVLILDKAGWAYAYRFHRLRLPTRETLWFFLVRDWNFDLWLSRSQTVALINVVSLIAVALGMAYIAWRVLARRVDIVGACAAATVVFLLGSKVYSVQYDLWLLPFLPLLAVSWRRWWVFAVLDVVLFLAIFELRASTVRSAGLPLILINDVVRAIWLVTFALAALRRPAKGSDPESVEAESPSLSQA